MQEHTKEIEVEQIELQSKPPTPRHKSLFKHYLKSIIDIEEKKEDLCSYLHILEAQLREPHLFKRMKLKAKLHQSGSVHTNYGNCNVLGNTFNELIYFLHNFQMESIGNY
uniref:Uncharacterized protein n=1 Tax=Romanomermis culicivorax TaxID=13658 RepID=A0A915KL78_ROMCU